MTDIQYIRFSCRGYSAAEMASRNDVLNDRELGWETDTLRCKLGDGVTDWASLPYAIRPVPTLISAFTNDAGYLTSVNNANWSGADLEIVNGGTGASSASAARTNLGLVIGINVQAYDPDLDTWAGITPGTGVGTFLATPSSANLRSALTDKTGTGVAVFADAPTLNGQLTVKGTGISTGVAFQTQDSAANPGFTVTDNGRAMFGTTTSTFQVYVVGSGSQPFVAQRDSSSTSLTASVVSGGAFRNTDLTNGNYSSLQFLAVTTTGAGITAAHIACVNVDHTNGSFDSDFAFVARNNNTLTEVLRVKGTGVVTPGADNTQDFGSGSLRWKEIFAGNAVINTSDERYKVIREGGDLSDAEYAAWSSVQAIVYQAKDAFERKGDAARLHVGYSWQAIRAAFEAQGLDAARYALWCEDDLEAPVTKTRPVKRQRVELVEEPFEEVQIIDGAPVLVRDVRMVEQPVFDRVPVTDAQTGGPALDSEGEPLLALVPVMEEITEEYTEMAPTGETRGALRYQECSVLETAWLRRRLALVEERLAALEPA